MRYLLVAIFGTFLLGKVYAYQAQPPSASTETALVSGTITLPPAQARSTRSLRGYAYRSRGTSDNSVNKNTMEDRFFNTIVSAHPVSYTIENLPTSDTTRIDQKDAVFIHKVTPVTVGSTIQFVNSDPFYHNVFSLTPGAKFNIGRRPTGDIYEKEVPPTKWKVSGLGPISIYCDIHTQMNAVILSLDTPYFTRTKADGTYQLSGLPPGTYELRVYNKDLELSIQKITVAAGESYTFNFSMVN